MYDLLSSFCIPDAICSKALGCYRIGGLFPCMSGKALVSVHHHLLPRVDMISRGLALVLCSFGYVKQRSSGTKQRGDETERNEGLPWDGHVDNKL